VGRSFEVASAADNAVQVLAGLDDTDNELPWRAAILRIGLAHGEVLTERLPVTWKGYLELGGDGALGCARIAFGREAPAEE
jgi:hypothetical protein